MATIGDVLEWVRNEVVWRVPKADLDQRDPDYIGDQLPEPGIGGEAIARSRDYSHSWRRGEGHSVDTHVSHPRNEVGLRVLRITVTAWMLEESTDDPDTAQDRIGVGRILW
jgi:hypothetical protein